MVEKLNFQPFLKSPPFGKNLWKELPIFKNFEALIESGVPSSDDPKFERRSPGAPWPTFLKSNDAKLFLISFLKALKSLETFRAG
jgi:hypothetical protein